jgi:hypothetical protein
MILAHAIPPFATRGLSDCTDEEDGLVVKVGTSKKGSTISLLAAVHLEHAPGPVEKEEKRSRVIVHCLKTHLKYLVFFSNFNIAG